MNPRLLAYQLTVASGLPWTDCQWATRITLDDTGTAHLVPLLVADVPAFVEAMWEAELPTPYLWSVAP